MAVVVVDGYCLVEQVLVVELEVENDLYSISKQRILFSNTVDNTKKE